ncbi:hypothetical protein [Kineococcus xinjiangensis]|nr:hypothetical protein [Kineococcus xinjiangensis]
MQKTMRWSAAVGAGFTLALGLVSPVAAGAAAPAAPTSATAAAARVQLPADWQARRAAAAERLGVEESPAAQVVRDAIDPGDYACGPTEFRNYIRSVLQGLSPEEMQFLDESGALDFPTYDAFVFGTGADPRYGLDAEYRQQLVRTFRDGQRFWDVKSGDIQLLGLNGSVLRDEARLTRLLVVVYGLEEADAAAYAAAVVAAVAQIPALQGGDNPIFSLNAFAFSGEGDPDPLFSSIPDKIVMGDGLNDAFEHMGIADVGPRAVLAHEFGHHVQFENDLFDSPLTGAEATRRTELMADALATYQLTHKRGLALNAKRVLQAERSFYEVGDCSFASDGHHGTPNQRMRASEWGAGLAASARKQGHILPSMTVAQRFDAVLPQLVAPDAP